MRHVLLALRSSVPPVSPAKERFGAKAYQGREPVLEADGEIPHWSGGPVLGALDAHKAPCPSTSAGLVASCVKLQCVRGMGALSSQEPCRDFGKNTN